MSQSGVDICALDWCAAIQKKINEGVNIEDLKVETVLFVWKGDCILSVIGGWSTGTHSVSPESSKVRRHPSSNTL